MQQTKSGIRSVEKSIGKALSDLFSKHQSEKLARSTGFIKRARKMTGNSLLNALVLTLSSFPKDLTLSDVHRRLNVELNSPIQFKPFHDQIRKGECADFLRATVEEAMSLEIGHMFAARKGSSLSAFEDIYIHDGSTMTVHEELKEEFPGRWTKTTPAAIEIHATISLYSGQPVQIAIAPDKEAEIHFQPEGESLRNKLYLADRGYEDHGRFEVINAQGGSYIVRGKKTGKPTIIKAYTQQGRRVKRLEGKRLSRKILLREDLDLIVKFPKREKEERLVVLYKGLQKRKKKYTFLYTNLQRSEYRIEDVGNLYRLRWQIENYFKELKSFCGLRKFTTTDANIVEVMIWASILCGILKRMICFLTQTKAKVEVSYYRVAKVLHLFLEEIFQAIKKLKNLIPSLRSTVKYLIKHALLDKPLKSSKYQCGKNRIVPV